MTWRPPSHDAWAIQMPTRTERELPLQPLNVRPPHRDSPPLVTLFLQSVEPEAGSGRMRFVLQRIPNTRRIGRTLLAASLLSLVLVGCVRLLEPRPGRNITYYLLDSGLDADTTLTDTTGLEVGLRRPHLASYLDATRIVTRRGSNAIQFSDSHRWGEDLDQAINRVVALNLEQSPEIQTVEVVPWPNGARFDHVIQLHVLRFEGVGPSPNPKADEDNPAPKGYAQMVVRWTIFGPDGTDPIEQGITRHREKGWSVKDYAELVSKLDTSLVVLSRDIGGRLRPLASQ